MAAPAQGILFGRYLLGPRLAVGGMGEVYLAVQTGLGRFEKPLALKLLLPHLAEEARFVQMFLDEASLAARMSHPNVVQILDVGVEQGTYFLAMELVRGASLSHLIKALAAAGKTLPADLVVHIARCLCDGLHHAHEQAGPSGAPLQLVHRDVNPQNVLLSVNGEVKLADFGIAKARDTQEEDPTRVRGKLEYLAPEQLRSSDVDRRADVYGLGVTLYQISTGDSPFRRPSREETQAAILSEEPASLAVTRPDLPPLLVDAVSRALAKQAADRFESARAMRDWLPPAPPGAAEALAALVEKHCQDAVARIEQQATEVLTLGKRTGFGTGTEALRPSATILPPPARPRRGAAFAALGVGLAGLAGAALWWQARGAPAHAETARDAPPLTAPGPAPVLSAAAATAEPLPAPPPAPKAPAAAAKARPAAPAPAPHAEVGYLNIDADPWALVSVAGRRVGETPIARYPVTAGQVSVELENPENGKKLTRRVKVLSGKDAFVRGDLR